MEDANKDYNYVEKILGKECIEIARNKYYVVRGASRCLRLEDKSSGDLENDYVRIKCFELAVEERREKITEVGVFQREFSQYINQAFPDGKCYLFDANEALSEVKSGKCTDAFVEAYKQTDGGGYLFAHGYK